MDKETLSNYGWIVVLVLVLAVMLALATPFGSFIAGAIKSTTAGLFSVNQAALGSAGIDVNDMVFENCNHLETEIRNATDTYTGDTCCKACGAVLQAGQTVRAKVPEGGKYTAADGTVYNPGDEMPETATNGDKYEYGDYIYTYRPSCRGWEVRVNDKSKTEYGAILESINGISVTNMDYTFQDCQSLVIAPAIPNGVTSMIRTFASCSKLTTAPAIPSHVTDMSSAFIKCISLITPPDMSRASSVTDMSGVFQDCKSLATAPIIPNGVTDMTNAFKNCTSLKVAPAIPSTVTNMSYTFQGCKSLTTAPDLSKCVQLTGLTYTFNNCTSLVIAPAIPSTIAHMTGTFQDCTSLTTAPVLPDGLITMNSVFKNCSSLKTYAGSTDADGDFSGYVIPETVTNMFSTFYSCWPLQKAPIIPHSVTDMSYTFYSTCIGDLVTINANPTSYDKCFWNTWQPIVLTTTDGACTVLSEIAATGNSGKVTVFTGEPETT